MNKGPHLENPLIIRVWYLYPHSKDGAKEKAVLKNAWDMEEAIINSIMTDKLASPTLKWENIEEATYTIQGGKNEWLLLEIIFRTQYEI